MKNQSDSYFLRALPEISIFATIINIILLLLHIWLIKWSLNLTTVILREKNSSINFIYILFLMLSLSKGPRAWKNKIIELKIKRGLLGRIRRRYVDRNWNMEKGARPAKETIIIILPALDFLLNSSIPLLI